jgi:hypothetical protein
MRFRKIRGLRRLRGLEVIPSEPRRLSEADTTLFKRITNYGIACFSFRLYIFLSLHYVSRSNLYIRIRSIAPAHAKGTTPPFAIPRPRRERERERERVRESYSLGVSKSMGLPFHATDRIALCVFTRFPSFGWGRINSFRRSHPEQKDGQTPAS